MADKKYFEVVKEIFWNIHEAEVEYDAKKYELTDYVKKRISSIESKIKGTALGNNIDELIKLISTGDAYATHEIFENNLDVAVNAGWKFWRKITAEEKEFIWNLSKNQYRREFSDKNKLLELKLIVKRHLEFLHNTINFLNRYVLTLSVEVESSKAEKYFEVLNPLLQKMNELKTIIEHENDALMRSDISSYFENCEEEKKYDQIELSTIDYITKLSKINGGKSLPKINSLISATSLITYLFSESLEKEKEQEYKAKSKDEKAKQKESKKKVKHKKSKK